MEAYNTLLSQLDMLNINDTKAYKTFKSFNRYVEIYKDSHPVVIGSIMFQLFCILLGEDAKKFIKSQINKTEIIINIPKTNQQDFIDYIDGCKNFLRIQNNADRFTVLMPLNYIKQKENRSIYMMDLFRQYEKFKRRFENEKTLFFSEDNVVASDITCPKCKNNRITTEGAVQTRSMDEGMNFFYICSTCKHKFSM
jgi:DNA-directed RNA polymerase subunit M/transcription elongation factor TFIIS